MASTYSALKIELIATGEQSGTWGTTTNVNLGDAALGEAITGSADVAFSSADVTITLTDTNTTQAARNLRLNLTGTSGGARNLILGSGCQIEKLYLVNNGLADAVTVKNTTGTGIAVAAGKTMFVYNNGTNVVDAITHLTSLTTGVLSASGATTFTANTASTSTTTGTTVITGGLGVSGRVNAANFDGIVGANTAAAGSFTSVTATSITNSGLTSGRVVYSTTGGLETDSANLLFNGTTLTANTIGAYTLSGTIAGGGNQINNVIIGTTTPLAGAFTTLTSNGATTFTAGTASTSTTTGTAVITGGLGVSGRVNAANFDGIVGANTAAAGSFTTINASTSITNAGLTSGRVTFAGASGLLSDSANLTFDGTNLLLNAATPNLQGTSSTGSVSLVNNSGGAFIRLFGGSHATRANFTDFINGSSTSTFASSGNLGINNDNPDCLLSVTGTDGAVGGAIRYTATSVCSAYMSADPNGLCLATDTAGITFRTGVTGNDPTDTGSEVVRITSAGLVGIGTSSPDSFTTFSPKLVVGSGSGGQRITIYSGAGQEGDLIFADGTTGNEQYRGTVRYDHADDAMKFYTNGGNFAMIINSSQNVGLGVTPSAWDTVAYIAMQLPSGGSLAGYKPNNVPILHLSSNWYYDNANKYVITGLASQYTQSAGVHSWQIAPSGSPGGTITFTQAMTLDTSGNLLVGDTSLTAASEKVSIRSNSTPNLILRSTGNSSMRFYNSSDNAANSCQINYYSGTSFSLETIPAIPMVFLTNNAERMRISSTGTLSLSKVGGSAIIRREVAQGSNGLSIQGNAADTIDDTNPGANVIVGGGPLTDGYEGNITLVAYGAVSASIERNSILFRNRSGANTTQERMRIDYLGNLLVGVTVTDPITSKVSGATVTPSTTCFRVYSDVSNACAIGVTSTGSALVSWYYNGANFVGSVTTNGTGVTYGTASDYRLKTNIVNAPSGNIDNIKVRSFNWIADDSHQEYGMVAQELIEVAPYAVSKPKNPDEMMGIDYSKLVPMMIKEIQDLKQRIATLENK